MIACCTPSFIFITDPCDVNQLANGTQYRAANCASILRTLGINPTTYTDPNQTSVGGIDGGNAHLKQEAARSWTAGVVLHPRFAPDLAFSIDSYDIRIDNAINTADAQTLADNCVDQPTIDYIFCAALRRNSTTGGINFFTVRPENVANFHTAGFDLNLNYAPLWQGSFDLTWTRGPITAAHTYSYFSRTARYTLNTLAGDPDIATPYNYYQARRRRICRSTTTCAST